MPPTPPARPPQRPASGPSPAEGRIGSIDIDKLTSELEKDILSTLTTELGGMLAATPSQPKERKEVRDDRPIAAPSPVRPPPQPPQSRPQDRAAENEQRERRVAYRLGREFDKLPVNMRNELIKTLSRTDDVKVREDVVIACASNFDKLPPEVRGLLRTLANDRDSRVREEVAFELNRNFQKISPEYRAELIPLLVRDIDVKVREDIVAAIAAHFDRLPPELQSLLRTLASDRKPGVRDQVQHEVLRNADKIPEAVKQELSQLMEKAAQEQRDHD
jgi:TRAP-type C4-dicarboxylate transport system substrate-binding protein